MVTATTIPPMGEVMVEVKKVIDLQFLEEHTRFGWRLEEIVYDEVMESTQEQKVKFVRPPKNTPVGTYIVESSLWRTYRWSTAVKRKRAQALVWKVMPERDAKPTPPQGYTYNLNTGGLVPDPTWAPRASQGQ
jgi:hypothetical protein